MLPCCSLSAKPSVSTVISLSAVESIRLRPPVFPLLLPVVRAAPSPILKTPPSVNGFQYILFASVVIVVADCSPALHPSIETEAFESVTPTPTLRERLRVVP